MNPNQKIFKPYVEQLTAQIAEAAEREIGLANLSIQFCKLLASRLKAAVTDMYSWPSLA